MIPPALDRCAGEHDGAGRSAQVVCLMAHVGQDARAHHAIAGCLRKAQCRHHVTAGQGMVAAVVCGPGEKL